MIKEKEKLWELTVTALLPLAFVGTGWLNAMAFVLDGHRHEGFRMAFTWGILACATLLMFLRVVWLYVKRPASRKIIRAAALIPAALAILFLWSLAVNADKPAILKSAVVEGFLLMSAWSAVLVIALENRLDAFLKVCRVYAALLAPVMVYYCVRFYVPGVIYGKGPKAVENLGVIDYLTLSYTLLAFCLFFLMERLLHPSVPGKRLVFWLDFSLYTLFSVSITLASAKGAILCLLTGAVLFLAYPFLCGRSWKPFLLHTASAALSVVLFATVCFPNALGTSRPLSFLGEISNSNSDSNSHNITAEDIRQLREILTKLGLMEDGRHDYSIVIEFVMSFGAQQALEDGRVTTEEYDLLIRMADKLLHTATGGRRLLWSNAVNEMKASPLTGGGRPMFYQEKYSTYPHNLFLELGTDFGVPVMLAVLGLGLWVFLFLIRSGLSSPPIAAATLFVLAQIPEKMLSGSVYSSSVFYQYGLCLLLACFLRESSQTSKKTKEHSFHENS